MSSWFYDFRPDQTADPESLESFHGIWFDVEVLDENGLADTESTGPFTVSIPASSVKVCKGKSCGALCFALLTA